MHAKLLTITLLSATVLIGAGCSNAAQETTESQDQPTSAHEVVEVAAEDETSPTETLPTPPESTGPQVPDLSFEDYDGNSVNLRDYAGQHIVVNSWAAWCAFCRDELPDLADLQEEFGDQVTIIAINRQETKRTAEKYSDDLGVTGELVLLLDPRDSFYRAIGGFSMPETIFVEPDGTIQFHKRGVAPKDELRDRINTLLAD